MKFEKITIENYKSIGNKNNSIFFGNDVIALVGKNGSGKSNILNSLNGIQLFKICASDTFENTNRFIENAPVKIVFQLRMTPKDYEQLLPPIDLPCNDEIVTFTFYKYTSQSIVVDFFVATPNGDKPSFFSKILRSDEKLCSIFDKLQNAINADKNNHGSEEYLFTTLKYWCNNWDKSCHNVNKIEWLKRYKDAINDDDIQYIRNYYNQRINTFFMIMPVIMYYKDDYLQDEYILENLQKDLKNDSFPNGLKTLIRALNISEDDFISMLKDCSSNNVRSLRKRMSTELSDFNKSFNEFYNGASEQIELSAYPEKGKIVFSVSRTGEFEEFKLSERSQGLKWYLMFFAALKSAKACKNALVLIDEPAIHLHVDAQKEVLKLFDTLKANGVQIIYTTHSPSMLNTNSWEGIKLIEKENNITEIFSPTTSRSGQKHLETLSPIQKAMGCTLNNTLAPSQDKLNLIVEGITDYYYLKAMFKVCEVTNEPYIIPACSADNIPNIASIFIGWGYDFKVLLDHDREGKNVYAKLKKMDIKDEIIQFVSISDNATIENLISDHEEIITRNEKGELKKSESAFRFLSKVESENFIPDDETKDNFRDLFGKIGIL